MVTQQGQHTKERLVAPEEEIEPALVEVATFKGHLTATVFTNARGDLGPVGYLWKGRYNRGDKVAARARQGLKLQSFYHQNGIVTAIAIAWSS